MAWNFQHGVSSKLSKSLRYVSLGVVLAPLLWFTYVFLWLSPPSIRCSIDFPNIYSSLTVLRAGGNAYDLKEIAETRFMISGESHSAAIPYPPATLGMLLPLTYFNLEESSLLWFWLTLATILFSVIVNHFRSEGRSESFTAILKALFLLTFLPIISLVQVGQLSILPLTGLGLILAVWSSSPLSYWRQIVTGLGVGLILAKPHLLPIVYLYMGHQIITRRLWIVASSIIITYGGATAVAIFHNQLVVQQYFASFMMPNLPPVTFRPPSFGGGLEYVLGVSEPWLRFLPFPIVSLVAAPLLSRTFKAQLSESAKLTMVVLPLSLIATPYLWTYDFVVWLPMFLALLESPATKRTSSLLIFSIPGILLLMNLFLFDGMLKVTAGNLATMWWYPFCTSILTLIVAYHICAFGNLGSRKLLS